MQWRGVRYFRSITARVMQQYCELEDGVIQEVFDPRLLNYRIDIERVLDKLPEADVKVLMSIHRDGLSQVDATRGAGITKRPDLAVSSIEVTAGRFFERAGVANLEEYLASGGGL